MELTVAKRSGSEKRRLSRSIFTHIVYQKATCRRKVTAGDLVGDEDAAPFADDDGGNGDDGFGSRK